jgi:ferric-dicitrate binding protein FerR (iron transport regulator)
LEQTELINKFLDGQATEPDKISLLRWVEAAPENARIFAEAKNLRAAGNFKDPTFRIDLKKEFDLTWSKLPHQAEESNNLLVSLRPLLRYTAAVVITGIMSYFLFGYAFRKNHVIAPITYHQVFTSKGQKTQLVLLDGTRVWLNSDSKLKYGNDYNLNERILYLEGEAFFEVAENPAKPFLVKTADITVKALGTSFNVKAFSNDDVFETSLLTGSVSIENTLLPNNTHSPVVLKPNQRYTFSERPTPTAAILEDKELIASRAWTGNVLVFQSESLAEIALKLERWFDVKVHVLDPSIINNIYSGTFKNKESIIQVLTVLKKTTPIGFSIRQRDIYIFKK